jgi:hypothetical protein
LQTELWATISNSFCAGQGSCLGLIEELLHFLSNFALSLLALLLTFPGKFCLFYGKLVGLLFAFLLHA